MYFRSGLPFSLAARAPESELFGSSLTDLARISFPWFAHPKGPTSRYGILVHFPVPCESMRSVIIALPCFAHLKCETGECISF